MTGNDTFCYLMERCFACHRVNVLISSKSGLNFLTTRPCVRGTAGPAALRITGSQDPDPSVRQGSGVMRNVSLLIKTVH